MIAMTPDGRLAISGGGEFDFQLRLWDLNERRCIKVLGGHKTGYLRFAITPDGRRAISGGGTESFRDWSLRVWDLTEGEQVYDLNKPVLALAAAADGRSVVSVHTDKALHVWDCASAKCVKELTCHSGDLTSISVAADSSLAVTLSEDGSPILWDLQAGSCLGSGHTTSVNCVVVMPNGDQALSVDPDGTACIWSLTTGTSSRRLFQTIHSVLCNNA